MALNDVGRDLRPASPSGTGCCTGKTSKSSQTFMLLRGVRAPGTDIIAAKVQRSQIRSTGDSCISPSKDADPPLLLKMTSSTT